MRARFLSAVLLATFVATGTAFSQEPTPQPAAPPAATVPQPTEPKLEKIDELERNNIRLTALVTQLQLQLTEARAQLQNTQVQGRASAFIEKMKKDHPDYEVNPETLELVKKKPAAAK